MRGRWEVSLPAMAPTLDAKTIAIAAGNESITLTDILVGAVFVCSGQSNMQLTVLQTINGPAEAASSSRYSASLRIFQVAMLPSYANVTAPQTNLTASTPWSGPSAATVGSFSAVCYYYGAHALERRPAMPIGLISSSWGGTMIEPWMTADAIQACGASSLSRPGSNADPGLLLPGMTGLMPCPSAHGTLWNSMIAPLLPLQLTGCVAVHGPPSAHTARNTRCQPKPLQNVPYILVPIRSKALNHSYPRL